MSGFVLARAIDAPLEKVWVAADFTRSAGPYPMTVRDAGDPTRNFAGFTRVVASGKRKIVETLLEVEPMRFYTYTLGEGAPVKEYRGRVEFTPKGSATQLVWSARFTPSIPGTGWIGVLVVRNAVGRIIDVIEAECRASAVPS